MAISCCQDHWAALRKEIDDRGLSHLVARDGKEAVDRVMQGAEAPAGDQKAAADAFDPLMGSWFRIMGVFMEGAGLGPMMGEAKVCPLCEVEKQKAGLAQNWLTGAADEALAGARHLGLIAGEQ